MQERHTHRERYFEEQAETSRNYYIPYLRRIVGQLPDRVLEVGCGEGGNLLPFAESGIRVVGVDIASSRIRQAEAFFRKKNREGRFIVSDILGPDAIDDRFPLLLLHDVIEHIEDKKLFLSVLKGYLSPGGVIFVGFPAWQMPFGGHQQIAHSKLISHLPFIHLLPASLYRKLLKRCGEQEATITELLEIKRTGCTVERFESLARQTGYGIVHRELYFLNPQYKVKFGLPPLKLPRLIAALPFLRNFFSTSCLYILSLK